MQTRMRGARRKPRHSRRSTSALSSKNFLRILAAIVVPVTLGGFLLTLSILQYNSARRDRKEDLNNAEWRRNEDLRRASELRREDQQQANNARAGDLRRFEVQRREERNESRIQREQEWKIIMAKYQDTVLRDYLKDMGDFLKKTNGSFTSNPLIRTLARVKTLNALQQLDGSRQVQIVRFLWEIERIIPNNDVLMRMMSTAELTNIDFQDVTRSQYFGNMAFSQIRLRNCSFATVAIIDRVNFTNTSFHLINFSSASIKDTDFSSASFRNVDFSYRFGRVTDFSQTSFRTHDILRKYILNTNFCSAWFRNVDFSYRDVKGTNFSLARFFDVEFSSTTIEDTDFSETYFFFSEFSSTKLANVNFSSVTFFSTDFSAAKLNRSTFAFSKLSAMDFSTAQFVNVNFTSVQLGTALLPTLYSHNIHLISILDEIEASNFIAGKIVDSLFVECNCRMADFSYSNLSGSVFVNANLKNVSFRNADLIRVNFTGANLRNADLTNTNISDRQLRSARSIQNAKLPNGTRGRDRNPIDNGNPHCGISDVAPWHIQNGDILVMTSKEDRNDCRFVLQSNSIHATMSQRVSLEGVWDGSYWRNSSVELHFRRSSGVSLELCGQYSNNTVLKKEISSKSE